MGPIGINLRPLPALAEVFDRELVEVELALQQFEVRRGRIPDIQPNQGVAPPDQAVDPAEPALLEGMDLPIRHERQGQAGRGGGRVLRRHRTDPTGVPVR